MLKITFLEFIIRGIPEGLIFFIAVHAFSKTKIQVRRYLFSSILYSVMVYLIRFLPIQNGVDSILNLIVLIIFAVIGNKIDIVKSIKAAIIIMLFEFILEGANLFAIQFVMKKDMVLIFKDPVIKTIYFIPSLLIFGCIVFGYYIVLLKRKELKNISYGKINK